MRALAAALVLLCLAPGARGAGGEPQKSVFILWGSRPDLRANLEVDRIIRSRLMREFGSDVDFYMEYVDTFRDVEEERLTLRDFIRRKYAGKRFDLVIPVADSAVQFLRLHAKELFPGVPIVAWAGRAEVEQWGSAPPITAVFVKFDVAGSLEFIRQLQPETRHVVIVSGAAPRDRPLLDITRSSVGDEHDGVEITYLVGLSVREMEARLSHLQPRSAVFWLSVTADDEGKRLVSRDVLARICQIANAPVYAIAASHMDTGIVGGRLADQAGLSEQTADIAVRVLRGARVQDIPIREVSTLPMVDWRALQRWGISESRLPAGTVVSFREPSMWDLYKWRIVGGAALCIGEALLIVALLVQGARRRRAERTADELRRELTHLSRVETVGALSGALAHELNQPLSAILSNAQAARRFLAMKPADLGQVREALDDIMSDDERAGEVIRKLRSMLKRTEAKAQLLDLNEAIRDALELARGDLIARGISVSTELQAGIPGVMADRVQLQQVLLNLIFNGCDAMAAVSRTERRLTLATGSEDGDGVGVRVVDRGTGIAQGDVEKIFQPFVTTKVDGLGLGLAICRSIVSAHGGRLWATNNEGPGATLHVALPPAGSPAGRPTAGH